MGVHISTALEKMSENVSVRYYIFNNYSPKGKRGLRFVERPFFKGLHDIHIEMNATRKEHEEA